jgi:hypothetical protein
MSRAKRRGNPIVASPRCGLEEQARHELRLEFVGVRSLVIEIALVAIAVYLQNAEVRGPDFAALLEHAADVRDEVAEHLNRLLLGNAVIVAGPPMAVFFLTLPTGWYLPITPQPGWQCGCGPPAMVMLMQPVAAVAAFSILSVTQSTRTTTIIKNAATAVTTAINGATIAAGECRAVDCGAGHGGVLRCLRSSQISYAERASVPASGADLFWGMAL